MLMSRLKRKCYFMNVAVKQNYEITLVIVMIVCQARNWNREDAMDRGKWKKLINIG